MPPCYVYLPYHIVVVVRLFTTKTDAKTQCILLFQWKEVEVLTHWGRVKMNTIFQTTFSNALSWIRMYRFQFRFHWFVPPRVQWTIFQQSTRWWLGAELTSHYLNQLWINYYHIYASPGLKELRCKTYRKLNQTLRNDSDEAEQYTRIIIQVLAFYIESYWYGE